MPVYPVYSAPNVAANYFFFYDGPSCAGGAAMTFP